MRSAIAERLDLLGLKKLRFTGRLIAEGKTDWRLEATLGATVTQPCAVTLEPVTTRIDQPVTRRYMADLPEIAEDEAEIPEDDSIDPLPDRLDLMEVMEEALALALPLYPRAGDAALGEAIYAPPGVQPMTDDDAKPLAGLAALRDKLQAPKDPEEDA